MNRLRVLKQRAAKNGIFVIRALDNASRYDIVDSCGPQGWQLSKREACYYAARAASKPPKTRMYATSIDGKWHRWNCEKVAAPFVTAKPCKCARLVVKSSPPRMP